MKISDAANLKLKFKNLFAAFFLPAGGNSFPSPSYKTGIHLSIPHLYF